MKKIITCILTCLLTNIGSAQSLYFPPLTGNAWDTLSPASLGWCDQYLDTLDDYLASNNTKAFLLLKDGKMVHEQYFGTFTRDSLWYWASAAKTLTAFAVGMAQQQGYLSITDTTSSYIGNGWTSCTPLQEEKITIWHQLTMTSGLDDQVPDNHCTLDTCLVYKADAGTRWAYHNAPYTMLDTVIESATGMALNTWVTTRIKQPTGMDGFFINIDYNNVFYSRARSMARFGLMILNNGNWNGTQVMTDTNFFNAMVNTSQNLNESYGYLWWLNGKSSFMVPGFQFVFNGSLNPNAPADLIMALGKNGQMLNVVPSQNLVYVRMGNAPGAGEVPITFNDSIWSILNQVMCTSTGMNSEVSNTSYTLVPNPAHHAFQINGVAPGDVVTLMSISGQRWMETVVNDSHVVFSTGTLRQGVYVVRIRNKEGFITTKKLMVVH